MSRDPTPLPVERLANGAARYVTNEGDNLDHLCWRHYGREWETPEIVLQANPGLAAHGARLPAGVSILLPFIAAQAAPRKERRRLFD